MSISKKGLMAFIGISAIFAMTGCGGGGDSVDSPQRDNIVGSWEGACIAAEFGDYLSSRTYFTFDADKNAVKISKSYYSADCTGSSKVVDTRNYEYYVGTDVAAADGQNAKELELYDKDSSEAIFTMARISPSSLQIATEYSGDGSTSAPGGTTLETRFDMFGANSSFAKVDSINDPSEDGVNSDKTKIIGAWKSTCFFEGGANIVSERVFNAEGFASEKTYIFGVEDDDCSKGVVSVIEKPQATYKVGAKFTSEEFAVSELDLKYTDGTSLYTSVYISDSGATLSIATSGGSGESPTSRKKGFSSSPSYTKIR